MADVKISALPAAASALSTDQHPVNQGGTTKRITNSQISDFVKGVAPSIVQNAGVAFGVQQNNTTGRTLIVVIALQILYSFAAPGTQQIDILTDASSPSTIGSMIVQDASSTTNPLFEECITIAVAPGGWYRIDNTSDPGAGNFITSVWEIAL